ncbi:MAG: tetratricopeptide repeat protein, partial [Bacteroidales bacterium]|nr:tetratricopeptide repeat protein [Bacteroidales bacterium]
MRKVVLILYVFILISYSLSGQEKQQVVNYEKKTFELYNQKNWPELIKWGKKAIENGSDYFYMRMRLGIAFYERQNYHRALIHFRKAAEFNPNNPYLLEYLYYANILINREKAALDVTKQFSSSMKANWTGIKVPKFKLGNLALQYSFSDFQAGLENIDEIPSEQNGYQVFEN